MFYTQSLVCTLICVVEFFDVNKLKPTRLKITFRLRVGVSTSTVFF